MTEPTPIEPRTIRRQSIQVDQICREKGLARLMRTPPPTPQIEVTLPC